MRYFRVADTARTGRQDSNPQPPTLAGTLPVELHPTVSASAFRGNPASLALSGLVLNLGMSAGETRPLALAAIG